MFGDLFTYGCNNINELSPAFQRKICEFIGKRRMIPAKMYECIVKDCVPSEGMRKAMAEEKLSKEQFIPLILNSPVNIEVKERCLSELAATDDTLKNIADFSEFWQELNDMILMSERLFDYMSESEKKLYETGGRCFCLPQDKSNVPLSHIDGLIPDQEVRPSDMHYLGKKRERVRCSKKSEKDDTAWKWGEDK